MNRLNGYIDSYVDQTGFRQHAGIFSGVSFGDTFVGSSGQIVASGANQFLIQAFGGSGAIRFINPSGTVAGIECRNTYNTLGELGIDGFFPAILSGVANLQVLYRGERNQVYLFAQYGDMEFVGNTAKARVICGSRPSPRLSGILYVPVNTGNANNEQGDFMSCLHSILKPMPAFVGTPPYSDPTTSAEMKALSLGIGTLFFNTGSGICNLMMGSGIKSQHFTTYAGGVTFPLSSTKETFTRLPISTPVIDDRHCSYASSPTGITIYSPGLYKCYYTCSFDRATANATNREVAVRAVLGSAFNGVGGGGGGIGVGLGSAGVNIIRSSISYAFATNTNSQRCSVHNTFLFNADSGDFFALEAALVDASASTDGLNLTTSGSLVLLEKIGAKRGNFN